MGFIKIKIQGQCYSCLVSSTFSMKLIHFHFRGNFVISLFEPDRGDPGDQVTGKKEQENNEKKSNIQYYKHINQTNLVLCYFRNKDYILIHLNLIYKGMLACFFIGPGSFFVARVRKALIILNLVFLGSITSSISPYFAAS